MTNRRLQSNQRLSTKAAPKLSQWIGTDSKRYKHWRPIRCPIDRSVQLYKRPEKITIRVKQDCGRVETEHSGKVLLKAWTQHHLTREPLLEKLVVEGKLEEIWS